MIRKRPKNLNLLTIRFPLPAMVSILHRISGVILFLIIPLLLWGLQSSLASAQTFDDVQQFIAAPYSKMVIWLIFSAFIYHFFAGIRHLLMDMGIGETLKGGRFSAMLTLVISAIVSILIGVWLW